MRLRYAAAVALLAATACTSGTSTPRPTSEPLPSVVTDPCPAPAELLARADEPTSGKRLPDVTLSCLGREGTVRMRALGKTPTVLNLWGSWCGPCRIEMPEFQKVHFALGTKVRFLGVDTRDFEREGLEAIRRAGVGYASVFDKKERVRRSVGSLVLPVTVLVGADGLVKNVHVGQLTGTELRADIAKYLGVS
jgi:cytochrome c biogenesis protein CcmG/thiol:disulfide interchange protein DsbE